MNEIIYNLSYFFLKGLTYIKENEEWVLTPGGKQLVKSSQTSMFYAKKVDNQLVLSRLGKNDSEKFLIAK